MTVTRLGSVAVLLAATVVVAAICGCSAPKEDKTITDWKLTVNGTTERILSVGEVRELPSVSGYGYAVSTTGTRYGPYTCKGVDIRDLAVMVGGITPGQQAWISAPDGYLWVFDADQTEGKGFVTFDEKLRETPAPPLRIILMYEQNGTPLAYDDGGPLRIAIISEKPGVVTEGAAWVKWVDRVEIRD